MAYKGYGFEVTGKVQGVFFRQTTVEEAQKLGLVGWVRNDASGSVQGEAQGPSDKADSLKDWLQHTGSPGSRIDKCNISNERTIDNLDYDKFEQRS
ncbi:hypothetical protein WJX74_000783 [Apatococcus lobatus]|uniref:Acylphosphatase n=1 Tax=Apatococcus lobatus TaxID=904363 RepID=A0AAW1QJ45_9CHLO